MKQSKTSHLGQEPLTTLRKIVYRPKMSEMISLFTYYGNSEETNEVTFESDWVTYTMKKQQGIPKNRTDQVEE